jgi:hypothetical protein
MFPSMQILMAQCIYLYSYTQHFFLADSVFVADPEQEVSRTEDRLSRVNRPVRVCQ